MISWALLALFSAQKGWFTHPLWWPFIPVALLLISARNARAFIVTLLAILKRFWKDLILATVLFLVVLIVYWRYPIIVFAATYIVLPASMVLFAAYSIQVWAKEWLHWHRWMRGHRLPMTIREFLELLDQNHTKMSCLQFVRTVREQGLLMAVEDTEVILGKLALTVEQTRRKAYKRSSRSIQKYGIFVAHLFWEVQGVVKRLTSDVEQIRSRQWKRRSKDHPSEQTGGEFFEHWLTDFTTRNEWRLSEIGPEFLDEIYILWEQVRTTRQDRG
jgi:hypothetical protein